ncbi:hypothetical protein LY78DRAFT_80183 [Colletotrichum sublineola]|nr:hypothetical protein LY78DRAFT_80183 [Colletotrichum sublineola]
MDERLPLTASVGALQAGAATTGISPVFLRVAKEEVKTADERLEEGGSGRGSQRVVATRVSCESRRQFPPSCRRLMTSRRPVRSIRSSRDGKFKTLAAGKAKARLMWNMYPPPT